MPPAFPPLCPTPAPEPSGGPGRLPTWVQILIALLTAVLGSAGYHACRPTPTPAPQPAPVVIPVPLPGQPVALGDTDPAGASAGRAALRPGERLLVSVIRHRAKQELTRNGFKAVGGDARPLSADEADALLSKLDDHQILAGAHERGKLGDGTILKMLGAVFEWVYNHREQIMEVVLFVLKLLSLFADAPATGPPGV